MAVDVVPDGKQGSTPENLVGSDAAVCNRIGSGSMSCGRDEPQDSAAKGWVVVTGASGGIGAVLTEQLAKEGYPVVMACRNLEKARPVQQAVMARSGVLYPLDLASLDSVRRFTGRLRSEKMQVAVLLNNAGVMNGGFRLTEDGLEEDLAVNYVGAAALAFGLLPLMDAGLSIRCRVHTVSAGSVRSCCSPIRTAFGVFPPMEVPNWRCCCLRWNWLRAWPDGEYGLMRPIRAWSIPAC